MYENIPTNLIIWMAKRNITDSAFAAKAGLARQALLNIKKGQFQSVTEADVDAFAEVLQVSRDVLLDQPAVVEIAYFPEVLNEYIVHKPRPAPELAAALGLSTGLIDQVRLKHIDRAKPGIAESKKTQIETLLTESQIALFEKEMGIRFTRNHALPSHRSSDSEVSTHDDTSGSHHRQKRSSPGSLGLGFIGESNSNKRQQVRGPAETIFADDLPPPLARIPTSRPTEQSVSPQVIVDSHGVPSPQPAPHPSEVPSPQPALHPQEVPPPRLAPRPREVLSPQTAPSPREIPSPQITPSPYEIVAQSAPTSLLTQQLYMEIEGLKRQLEEARNQQASSLSVADESEVVKLRAELNILKQQVSQSTILPPPTPVDGIALLQTMLALLHQQSSPGFYQSPPPQDLLSRQITALNMQVATLEERLSRLGSPTSFYQQPVRYAEQLANMPGPLIPHTEYPYGYSDYPPPPGPVRIHQESSTPPRYSLNYGSGSSSSISGHFTGLRYPTASPDYSGGSGGISSPARPVSAAFPSSTPSSTTNPGMSGLFPPSSSTDSQPNSSSLSSTPSRHVFGRSPHHRG